jgi:hypothetical protein
MQDTVENVEAVKGPPGRHAGSIYPDISAHCASQGQEAAAPKGTAASRVEMPIMARETRRCGDYSPAARALAGI